MSFDVAILYYNLSMLPIIGEYQCLIWDYSKLWEMVKSRPRRFDQPISAVTGLKALFVTLNRALVI